MCTSTLATQSRADVQWNAASLCMACQVFQIKSPKQVDNAAYQLNSKTKTRGKRDPGNTTCSYVPNEWTSLFGKEGQLGTTQTQSPCTAKVLQHQAGRQWCYEYEDKQCGGNRKITTLRVSSNPTPTHVPPEMDNAVRLAISVTLPSSQTPWSPRRPDWIRPHWGWEDCYSAASGRA